MSALGQKRTLLRSLDHLVSTGEKRWRHRKTKHLSGFEIDRQLKLGWRLHRHVGWLLALEDTIDIAGRLPERVGDLPFPVLSDIDLGYSLSLGLIFWVGAEIQKLYEQAGVELEKYQGNRGCFLPMAAKFIVGHDGLVAARQVNIEFRERMEPETIIATLRELQTKMSG